MFWLSSGRGWNAHGGGGQKNLERGLWGPQSPCVGVAASSLKKISLQIQRSSFHEAKMASFKAKKESFVLIVQK